MNNCFNKLFWGFLFVLLEIHFIVIDLLPDPVGYFLIYSGIKLLEGKYPVSNKIKNLVIGLIFLSIPTVFIKQNVPLDQLGISTFFVNEWSIYMIVLGLFKLILVFFVFQIMIEIVHERRNQVFINRTSKTFTIYMTIMLIITISQSFTMNLYGDILLSYTIISSIIGLIMEISFLVLLRKFSKLDEYQPLIP